MDATQYIKEGIKMFPQITTPELRFALMSQIVSQELDETDPIHICIILPSEDEVSNFKQTFTEYLEDSLFVRQGTIEDVTEADTYDRVVQYLDYDKKLTVNSFTSLYSVSEVPTPSIGHLPEDKPLVTLTTTKTGGINPYDTIYSQNPVPDKILSQYDVVYGLADRQHYELYDTTTDFSELDMSLDTENLKEGSFDVEANRAVFDQYKPKEPVGVQPSRSSVLEFCRNIRFTEQNTDFNQIKESNSLTEEDLAYLVYSGRRTVNSTWDVEISDVGSGRQSIDDLKDDIVDYVREEEQEIEGCVKTETVFDNFSGDWSEDEIDKAIRQLISNTQIYRPKSEHLASV